MDVADSRMAVRTGSKACGHGVPCARYTYRGHGVTWDYAGARGHGAGSPWARGRRKFRDFVAEIGDFLGKIGEILGMHGGEKIGES